MIKKVVLLIVALSLCGCSATPDPQKMGPYPSNYRALIKVQMKETFVDPYSLRDVSISTPAGYHYFMEQGWLVCVQANAKNSLGGYTGLETTAYLISKGEIAETFHDQSICDNVAMTSWPEMDGGGLNR